MVAAFCTSGSDFILEDVKFRPGPDFRLDRPDRCDQSSATATANYRRPTQIRRFLSIFFGYFAGGRGVGTVSRVEAGVTP